MRGLANQTSINGWIFKNKKRRNYTLMDCLCVQPPFGIIIIIGAAVAGSVTYTQFYLLAYLISIRPRTHTRIGCQAIDNDTGIFLVSNFQTVNI